MRPQPIVRPGEAARDIRLAVAGTDARPNLRLGTDQADQASDRPADACVDLDSCTSIVRHLDCSHHCTKTARINEAQLRQIHMDADATDDQVRDASVELTNCREVQVPVQGEPHDTIRSALLPDVKSLQL
jgi:hypothetical protein